MRVAMVSEHASPLAALGGVDAGGQNVHVASLARAIGARGHEVIVYTRRDDATMPRRVTFAPRCAVHHIDAGPPRPLPKEVLFPLMPAFAAELRRDLALHPPDVVHTHFWMSGYAGLLALEGTKTPLAHTFHALGVVRRRHQGDADKSPPQRLDVERALVARADHIISTCRDEVFELRRLGLGVERVSVVPCGVDLEVFRPEGPAASRRPGWHRVVVVSRLVPRKGIDDVIRALARVPSAELCVAGGPARAKLEDDPEAQRLRRIAAAAGVSDRFFMKGQLERPEVAALLRSADVAVTTPWYEPFGIVPLEVMACGIPIIASAVGGIIDTVVDGMTGVHVPPRDASSIAKVLNDLLGRPYRRFALGAAGAERVQSRYGWPRIGDSALEVYSRLQRPSALSTTEVR
jgi:D-inositol-3-phosphate glycosyltransferase